MTPRELVKNHIVQVVNLDDCEVAKLFQPDRGYKTACTSVENRKFYVDRDSITNEYFWWEKFSISAILKGKEQLEKFTNESTKQFQSEKEAWRNCAESNGIKPQENHTLEVWLISDWLYGKLEERNESIVHWKGLPLWCKTATSYPLHEESLIQTIAAIA